MNSKYIVIKNNDRIRMIIMKCLIHMVSVGSRPQLIGFIRFGEPVPHGLSARPRVWAGPTKG